MGAKRNFVALICGLVAPPFLGLLACYDTRRALTMHRYAVVIFFTLTIVYVAAAPLLLLLLWVVVANAVDIASMPPCVKGRAASS